MKGLIGKQLTHKHKSGIFLVIDKCRSSDVTGDFYIAIKQGTNDAGVFSEAVIIMPRDIESINVGDNFVKG